MILLEPTMQYRATTSFEARVFVSKGEYALRIGSSRADRASQLRMSRQFPGWYYTKRVLPRQDHDLDRKLWQFDSRRLWDRQDDGFIWESGMYAIRGLIDITTDYEAGSFRPDATDCGGIVASATSDSALM